MFNINGLSIPVKDKEWHNGSILKINDPVIIVPIYLQSPLSLFQLLQSPNALNENVLK